MRRLHVKIVPRAIEVHWEQDDRVEALLLPMRLGLDQHHLLFEAVGGVGLFGISGPKILFTKRHRRMLGIRANRTHPHTFL